LQQQHTLAEKLSCDGKGLHSGASVGLTVRPSRENTGIVFIRSDLPEVEIPACPSSVSSIQRATTLARGRASVSTVEHLLAALYACCVDTARVEVEGPEVPVLDGSARHFVSQIGAAGLFEQRAPRSRLRVRRRVEVRDGNRYIAITPADGFGIRYAIDFDHPAIRRQELEIEDLGAQSFERELASARTFGFLDEVAALRAHGLGLGGDLDNTVVLDHEKVINPGGLRFADEFVRHKTLDLVGDLALLGIAIEGEVEVERGGHALHQRLVAAILEDPSSCEWIGAAPHTLFRATAACAAAG